MEQQAILCLIIFVLTIIGFLLQKWSLAQTAMMGMLLMLWTGCLTPAAAMSSFASTSTLLMSGTFVVAAAFGKTQTVSTIAHAVSRASKGSLRRVLAGYVLLAVVVNEFIANTVATFCIIWPLALASAKEMNISPSKFAFPIGVATICGTGMAPLTASISMSEFYRQFFIQFDMAQYAGYTVMDYCIIRTPISVLTILYTIFIAAKLCPARVGVELTRKNGSGEAENQLTRAQEIITVATFLLMILGIAFSSKIGAQAWQFAVTAAVIICVAGVLKGREIYLNMGISVVLLIAGGTSIAAALQQTGAADLIGQFMLMIFGSRPNGYLFGLAFYLVSFVLTQVMSDVAVNQIFVPICLMACKAIGANPVGPVFLSIAGGMTSFLTPMANPTAPIMFEVGGYKIRDALKIGLPLCAAICTVSVLWVMSLYPLYG